MSEGCFLCEAAESTDDRARLVLLRDPHVVVLLNRFPYNNGHLMIAPRVHGGDLAALDPAVGAAIMRRTQEVVGIFQRVYGCDGVNIGMNIGEAAGAGVPGHLHMHTLPRWSGDTNFMPAVAGVRVIPEHLHETWAGLKPHFDALTSG